MRLATRVNVSGNQRVKLDLSSREFNIIMDALTEFNMFKDIENNKGITLEVDIKAALKRDAHAKE